MKQYLLRLRDYSNIPRKQKPFTNFVKNSLNLRTTAEVEQLWAIVQKATAPQVPKPGATSPKSGSSKAPGKSPKVAPSKSPKVSSVGSPKSTPGVGLKRSRQTDDEIIQEEIRAALSTAGGRLKWRKLRDQVVPKLSARGIQGDPTDLGERVVASIPDEYCNEKDAYVR